MIIRAALAVVLSATVALVGGFASKALGSHHFWPGVIVSFLVFVSVWLCVLSRSWS